jgi:aryl-alcohol dehydrogenase-like predicted oxidoreductase
MTQRPEPYQEFESDQTFDALDRLQTIAARRGTSLAGVALAWLLADDRVNQIVIGPGRPGQLTPVRQALENPLTAEELIAVQEAVGP